MAKRELIFFTVIFKRGVAEEVARKALRKLAPKLKWNAMEMALDGQKSKIFGFGECTKEKFEKLFGAKLSFTDKVRNALVRRPVTVREWKTKTPLVVPEILVPLVKKIYINVPATTC